MGQVTADLIHYHIPTSMGYSDIITRSGYPGVVAAAAAPAAAALTAAAAARMPARPLEQTPEPNAGPSSLRHN